jgi:hypothetical protein
LRPGRRLTTKERKRLRLMAASLAVSDYTGKVDTPALQKATAKRTHRQVKEICSMFTGLVVGMNYNYGQKIIDSRTFDEAPYETSVFHSFARLGLFLPSVLAGWLVGCLHRSR